MNCNSSTDLLAVTRQLHELEKLNTCAGSQGIPHNLKHAKVQYLVQNSLSLIPILGQMIPFHAVPHIFLRLILILNTAVLWGVTRCSLVDRYVSLGLAASIFRVVTVYF